MQLERYVNFSSMPDVWEDQTCAQKSIDIYINFKEEKQNSRCCLCDFIWLYTNFTFDNTCI